MSEGASTVRAEFALSGTDFNLWTGHGNVTLDSVVHTGIGDIISVSSLPVEVGSPEKRASITISAADAGVRAALVDDSGPVRLKIRMVMSTDGGATWSFVGNSYIGRLSNPRIQGESYTVDVSGRIDDIDRGRDFFWSDTAQKLRHPGDRGLEYAAETHESRQFKLRWPP